MPKRRRNTFASALVEGIAGSIGSKAVDHMHKALTKKKRKNPPATLFFLLREQIHEASSLSALRRIEDDIEENYNLLIKQKPALFKLIKAKKLKISSRTNSGSSEFIGVRVNGSKVQLKLPNKNPSTLKQAKAIAGKLGYRVNPAKSYKWVVVRSGGARSRTFDTKQEANNLVKIYKLQGAKGVRAVKVFTAQYI